MNIQDEDTVFAIYEPLYTVYPETLTDPEKFWVSFSLDALLSRHSRFCLLPSLSTNQDCKPSHYLFMDLAWPNEADFVVHSHVV